MKCHHFKSNPLPHAGGTETDQPRKSKIVNRKSRGFTLIELLLVLTILGILAAIVVPRLAGRSEDARKAAAVSQITVFKNALNLFEMDNGGYPRSLVDLIQQPHDAKKWRPYLDTDAIPNDPWGNPYVYTCPGKHNSYSFDIQSAGTDGQLNTDDDIGNWTVK